MRKRSRINDGFEKLLSKHGKIFPPKMDSIDEYDKQLDDITEPRIRCNTLPSVPSEYVAERTSSRSESELMKYLTSSEFSNCKQKSILHSLLTNDVPNLTKTPHWANSGANLELLADIVTEHASKSCEEEVKDSSSTSKLSKSDTVKTVDSGFLSSSSFKTQQSISLGDLKSENDNESDELNNEFNNHKDTRRRSRDLESLTKPVKFFLDNNNNTCKVCLKNCDSDVCKTCQNFFESTLINHVKHICLCSSSFSIKECPACRLKKCFEKGLKFDDETKSSINFLNNLLSVEPKERLANIPLKESPNIMPIVIELCDEVLADYISWSKNVPKFLDLTEDDRINILEATWMELLVWGCIWKSRIHCGQFVQFAPNLILNKTACLNMGPPAALLLDLCVKVFDLKLLKEEFVLLKAFILINGCPKKIDKRDILESIRNDVQMALQEFTTQKYNTTAIKRTFELLSILPHVRQISEAAVLKLFDARDDASLNVCNLLKDILFKK